MSRAHEESSKRHRTTDRWLTNIGMTLVNFEERRERLEEESVFLKGFSVKLDGVDEGDVFIVLRADTEDGARVAFGSGPTLAEALRSTLERLYNRTLKWKEDQYA